MKKLTKSGKRRLGKHAFLTDVLIDFWAYLAFVLVVIVFATLFKWSAEASKQAIEDTKDVTYGNYMTEVYLRTPLNVGTAKMSMAELIAFYDYNQTLEKGIDKSYAEVAASPIEFFYGKDNQMKEAFRQITADFISKNFDQSKCYAFMVHGNSFDYVVVGKNCLLTTVIPFYSILSNYNVPKEAYVTYLPSVDPRSKPIEVYCVYDLARLLKLYAPQGYSDIKTFMTLARVAVCSPIPPFVGLNAVACVKLASMEI
jgi:hypothetical protein